MADSKSALQSEYQSGRYGAGENTTVTLSEITGFSLLQVAAWPERLAAVGQRVADHVGQDAAPGPGCSWAANGTRVLRAEPLKWWLISAGPAAQAPSLSAEDGSVLDLSQARSWISLKGENSAKLLNNFLPLDLRDAQFGDGAVANTAMHHVGVTLWRDGDSYHVLLPRSYALSLWQLLFESAKQYGVLVV